MVRAHTRIIRLTDSLVRTASHFLGALDLLVWAFRTTERYPTTTFIEGQDPFHWNGLRDIGGLH